MKKTLFTFFALSLLAVADAATVTISSLDKDAAFGAIVSAFDFTLNNSSWLTADGVLSDSVKLNRVTLDICYPAITSDFGLVVYHQEGGSWNLVGASTTWFESMGAYGYDASHIQEFDFDALELAVDTTYTIVLYSHKDSYAAPTATLTSLIQHNTTTAEQPVGVTYLNYSGVSSENVYDEKGALKSDFTPSVIFNVTTSDSVPEPATASLSLLGMAALMMRRRRA